MATGPVPPMADELSTVEPETAAARVEDDAEHAQVLIDQEQMSTADFRERAEDVVVTMAATGQTGSGFPEEYGGGGLFGARSCSWARGTTTTSTSPTS